MDCRTSGEATISIDLNGGAIVVPSGVTIL